MRRASVRTGIAVAAAIGVCALAQASGAAGSKDGYHAVAGALIVHPQEWNDAAEPKGNATASSMFYVAYFKDGEKPGARPITFLYNGGPGSPSVWLHMGAFGPKRVVTGDHSHTPPAPYQLVNNDYSLLDASDLVFVDATGTGFSRMTPGAEKDFLGVDEDVHAYSDFVMQFLSRYGRWNSRCSITTIRRTWCATTPGSTSPTSCRCRPMPRLPGTTTSCRARGSH